MRRNTLLMVQIFFFGALAVGCAAPQGKLTEAAIAPGDTGLPAPLTLKQLAKRRFETTLQFAGPLAGGNSFSAYLVAYEHAGLKLHALVAVPKTQQPKNGYPVVIANHGYVPEPANYGTTSARVNSRPGDYYRSVPELYTARGFLVVMADYRGHNDSQGYEYIDPQDDNSVGYYTEDVVALMAGLGDLEQADTRRVFMWSHSMGGPVAMRAMLATNLVRAASFWSTMPLDDYKDEYQTEYAKAGVPIVVHHSRGDTATAYENSSRLAEGLAAVDRLQGFFSYDGGEHLFCAADREAAADRDAALFLSF